MRKLAVKSIAVLLALTTSAACLAGCGKKKSAFVEDDKEISIAIIDPNVPASEGTAESNRYTKYIEKETGYKIKWYIFPSSDYNTKLNAMLAAGEAPDMFYNFSMKYVSGLVNDGLVMPLDDLIDEYSTDYKNYIKKHKNLENWTRFSDGKTYAFTSARSVAEQANTGVWIRKDWLDKLGLEMPKTAEDLYNVAKAFKTLGSDILPIAYSHWIWPQIYQAYTQYYVKDDGSGIEFGPTSDRYADALDMMKRCYKEGLLDPEFFVDNNASRQIEMWNNGKVGILFKQWYETDVSTLLKNDPDANPVPLECFSTQYGNGGYFQECPPFRFIMLNADAKNPVGCMKLLDWMIGGGWERFKFGEEGVHYKLDGEIPVTIVDSDTVQEQVTYAKQYLMLQDYKFEPSWIMKMASSDDFSQRLASLRKDSLTAIMKHPYRRDLPYDPPLSSIQRAITEYETERDKIMLKVTTGADKYDGKWGLAESRAEWERVGGKDADKEANEWYKKNKDKLPKEGLSISAK